MKKRKWPVILSLFLVLVLIVLNLYVFFRREWESSFYPSSYATLYYPLDVPTIRQWELTDRNRIRLNLAWTGEIKEWSVLTDGGKEQAATGMTPSFPYRHDIQRAPHIQARPRPERGMSPVEVSIRFYSRSSTVRSPGPPRCLCGPPDHPVR